MRSWLTGKILTHLHLGEESHGVCLIAFFPAFCSLYSTHLCSDLSGQAVSLLINQ